MNDPLDRDVRSMAVLDNLQLKRKSIETGHLQAWLTRGKGSFHLENIDALKPILVFLLKMTGLYKRGVSNTLNPIVNRFELYFDDLPDNFDGFRIMQLSDIHIDASEKLTDVILRQIDGLTVDLCVLTGDYRFEIYGPLDNVFYYMERLISGIDSNHGIIGILGNHDFIEVVPGLEKMGVNMLINDSMHIQVGNQKIFITGVDDPHYYGCDDLDVAMVNVPEGAFKILLVHTPELYKEAADNHFQLYLCGHTHGGQIRLPLIGPIITNASAPRKMAMGKWRFSALTGYTNAGIGFSMAPVRYNCPPEIAIIELRKGSEI
jgi:uncharacterized protein